MWKVQIYDKNNIYASYVENVHSPTKELYNSDAESCWRQQKLKDLKHVSTIYLNCGIAGWCEYYRWKNIPHTSSARLGCDYRP